MSFIDALFNKKADRDLKDRVAELLRTDPAQLERFEAAYRASALSSQGEPDNFFDVNSRQASAMLRENAPELPAADQMAYLEQVVSRAVAELVGKTPVLAVTDGRPSQISLPALPEGSPRLGNDDLKIIPETVRPQATGDLMKVDLAGDMSCIAVLENYREALQAKSPERRAMHYNMFRQGLDILDLDPVLYEMLGMNRNAMSHWLPQISEAAAAHGFFRIPETRIAKVPLPILQLSRTEYSQLTPSTLKIVDDWAMEAFGLDVDKTYFIKTGTFSSKFDFRNAKVTGEKEVRELGEYLLFIQHQATMMAGPLSQPSIYGASTTNEWVVREFIEDVENNPCIYKGMPLRTEYRVFVDFDTREILGINPYWDPDVMKSRFADQDDASSPHQRHDYVIYKMHEPVLMGRYEANKDRVLAEIAKLLPDTKLDGQWSIDVMQNGNDFWIIDMATADTSALSHCVPAGRIKKAPEDWIPALPQA